MPYISRRDQGVVPPNRSGLDLGATEVRPMARLVTVFNQPGRIFCRRVEEFLTQHGIPFQARNVADDPAAMAELERLDVASTPVTVIDGQVVVGCDRKRLAALLGLPET